MFDHASPKRHRLQLCGSVAGLGLAVAAILVGCAEDEPAAEPEAKVAGAYSALSHWGASRAYPAADIPESWIRHKLGFKPMPWRAARPPASSPLSPATKP